jgi:crotonobetaine/carnitine-CoA ligase
MTLALAPVIAPPVIAPHERTLAHVLRKAAAAFPDKDWLATDAGSATYGEMEILSNRLANGLGAEGIRRGQTVLVMMPDIVAFVALWAALCKTGAIEVPLNTAYRGDILVHVANDSRAETCIIDARFLERFEAVAERLPHVKRVFVHGDATAAAPLLERGVELLPFTCLLVADASPPAELPRHCDIGAVMYTSGTTGASKGVMIPHAQSFEYTRGCGGALALGPDDVYYTAGLPLFHIAGRWGVVYAAALVGATAAVPRQFSASSFWADVVRFGATATFLLGAMANFLQRQPPVPSDGKGPLRKVMMCPLLPDLDRFIARFNVRVCTAYGSTEVGAPIALPLGAAVSDNRLVGQVRTGQFEVAILDDNDEAVANGVVGEIAVRAMEPWTLMAGYWNRPEATISAWRNLWLHSGDAGRSDEAGNIYFVDRLKDAIRRRGENISSMEVEDVIRQHPSVQECAVFPVPAEHGEEEVMAAIVVKPGLVLDPTELIGFLTPRMAYFMLPRYVDLLDDLPKTPTGKIQKYALRQRGAAATTWDRETAGLKIAR